MNETNAIVPVQSKWTQFWDMHSGGQQKLETNQIFIEAPEAEAIQVFYHRFGRDPYNVTCDCCGGDYSISESESLGAATRYHRNAELDDNGEERRERRSDKIILDMISRNPEMYAKYDPLIPKLYRMAKDKSSPLEAQQAMDRLATMDVGHMWHAKPLIPLDEYVKTITVIRAEDIRPDERQGHIKDRWDW